MKFITAAVLVVYFSQFSASLGEEVTVRSAEVATVRSVDDGFKTFVQRELGAPVTRTLENGESFTVEAFQLFTDEDKVNPEEGEGGDTSPYRIAASVVLGPPANRELFFSGNTYGEEDLSVIPAHLRPILGKENPTPQERLALLQWGNENPELAKQAGGRGVVEWIGGEQEVDLGLGKRLRVRLNNTFYNEGLQFGVAGAGFGTGPGNAGTVTATVQYVEREVPPRVESFLLEGLEMRVSVQTRVGYTYTVERWVRPDWVMQPGETAGTGEVIEIRVDRDLGRGLDLVRVRETRNP